MTKKAQISITYAYPNIYWFYEKEANGNFKFLVMTYEPIAGHAQHDNYWGGPSKGNKISKRPPILSSSSIRCQKRQQKITLNSNLLYKFKWGVIFCCHFWHRLEDEVEIGGLFEILLPLTQYEMDLVNLKVNMRGL